MQLNCSAKEHHQASSSVGVLQIHSSRRPTSLICWGFTSGNIQGHVAVRTHSAFVVVPHGESGWGNSWVFLEDGVCDPGDRGTNPGHCYNI